MALLTKKQRQKRFTALGLGSYNATNIKKFQRTAFKDAKRITGKYNKTTDRALRHWYNVRTYTKNFSPEEFKCTCGRCSGYPSYMKRVELKHLQKIRDHYGKPMTITCGLRCKAENTAVGGVPNSGHLKGYAADFYMKGVTDTTDNRVKALSWIEQQDNHQFTYGAYMRDSDGLYRTAAFMGNAMHTETHKPDAKPSIVEQFIEALKEQSEWSKKAVYKWVNPPTVANSKIKKTCIALPMVALQRMGVFKNGWWFYLDLKTGKINGPQADYVKKHTEIFDLQYPNKSVIELAKSGKIKKGDIIAYTGGRGHIMVYMGKNTKGQHIYATGGHVNSMAWVSTYFNKRPVRMLVRLKEVKS